MMRRRAAPPSIYSNGSCEAADRAARRPTDRAAQGRDSNSEPEESDAGLLPVLATFWKRAFSSTRGLLHLILCRETQGGAPSGFEVSQGPASRLPKGGVKHRGLCVDGESSQHGALSSKDLPVYSPEKCSATRLAAFAGEFLYDGIGNLSPLAGGK